MNLFRSEEHARRWSGYRADAAAGLLSLGDALEIVRSPNFRERPNGHYVSSAPGYRATFMERLKTITRNDPFWNPTPA
jgi:hypothetical protein